MAYLIVHSKFFPRLIGVLLAIEGLGYLVNSFSLFLAPALEARIFPYFARRLLSRSVGSQKPFGYFRIRQRSANTGQPSAMNPAVYIHPAASRGVSLS